MDKPRVLVITPVDHIEGLADALSSAFNSTFMQNINRHDLLSLHESFDAVFCNPNKQNFIIDEQCMSHLEASIVCTASTGLNHISSFVKDNYSIISLTTDFDHIRKISSTAELAITLSFSLVRNLVPSVNHVIGGGWDYTPFVGRQFDQLKFGTVGLGRLGFIYLDRLSTFSNHLYYYDPNVNSSDNRFTRLSTAADLFEICDVVSINIHATPENKYFISRDLLSNARNKPFYLINTSRGEVVDEHAIADRLSNDLDFYYGADVLEHEFSDLMQSPLNNLIKSRSRNLLITPHIGGMTFDAQKLAYFRVFDKLVNHFQV